MSTALPLHIMTAAAAAPHTGGKDNYIVYLFFAVAGFLVGGAWAAYKAKNKLWLVITVVCAIIAAAAGVMKMLTGEF